MRGIVDLVDLLFFLLNVWVRLREEFRAKDVSEITSSGFFITLRLVFNFLLLVADLPIASMLRNYLPLLSGCMLPR